MSDPDVTVICPCGAPVPHCHCDAHPEPHRHPPTDVEHPSLVKELSDRHFRRTGQTRWAPDVTADVVTVLAWLRRRTDDPAVLAFLDAAWPRHSHAPAACAASRAT
jgi:hypothetical protein